MLELTTMSGTGERRRAYQEMVKHFKERLRFALSLSPKGQNEVAREVGASNSVASSWFALENETLPGGKFLARLPGALRVNGHWLLTGEGHWYPAPVSGRKDVLFMEGMEVGARGVVAQVRAALGAAERELEEALRTSAERARAAFEEMQAGEPADAAPARRPSRGQR